MEGVWHCELCYRHRLILQNVWRSKVMVVTRKQIKPPALAFKYISSSSSPAIAAASPEHCVQMMELRLGSLTNDEVWQWFVLPLHESFERKITSCMRESTDSRLFLYS